MISSTWYVSANHLCKQILCCPSSLRGESGQCWDHEGNQFQLGGKAKYADRRPVGVREAKRVGEPNVLLKEMVQDDGSLAPAESLPISGPE